MDFSEARWSGKWPNFTPKEIACKCCGEIAVDEESMDALQRLRDRWGEPLVINSGHRCFKHNMEVGGAPVSQHLTLQGTARSLRQAGEAVRVPGHRPPRIRHLRAPRHGTGTGVVMNAGRIVCVLLAAVCVALGVWASILTGQRDVARQGAAAWQESAEKNRAALEDMTATHAKLQTALE